MSYSLVNFSCFRFSFLSVSDYMYSCLSVQTLFLSVSKSYWPLQRGIFPVLNCEKSILLMGYRSQLVSPSQIILSTLLYTCLLKFPFSRRPISCISFSASKSALTSQSKVNRVLVKWSMKRASKPVYWFQKRKSYLFRSPYGCSAIRLCLRCCLEIWASQCKSRQARASSPPIFKVCSSILSDMKSDPFERINSSGSGEQNSETSEDESIDCCTRPQLQRYSSRWLYRSSTS